MIRLQTVFWVTALSLFAVACERESEPLEARPNVLLISIDSLRADRLGVYGNPRNTSPTIDRIAREGVRFSQALSPTSWTLPAHATLLTGLGQRRHRVVNVRHKLAEEVETLPEAFLAAGYETFGIFSGPFLHPVYGLGQGFERYASCMSKVEASPTSPQAWQQSHIDRTNPLVEKSFIEWLDSRSDRPFFAFVHMWDVHYDYLAPEPYYSMFDTGYAGKLDGRNIARKGFPVDATADDVDHLLSLYDAEIRYTDATLGKMLAALEAKGLLDNTVVVITADHGEEFLDHGAKGHQHTLFDELIRVPLVFWARGRLPRGVVIDEPVGLSDIAPTIAELAGIAGAPSVDGTSLVPFLRGDGPESRPVFSVLYEPLLPRIKLAAVRVGTQKLIYRESDKAWLSYDLAVDPGEQAPTEATLDALRSALTEYVAQSSAYLAEKSAGEEALPRDVSERLRQLGYVEGD